MQYLVHSLFCVPSGIWKKIKLYYFVAILILTWFWLLKKLIINIEDIIKINSTVNLDLIMKYFLLWTLKRCQLPIIKYSTLNTILTSMSLNNFIDNKFISKKFIKKKNNEHIIKINFIKYFLLWTLKWHQLPKIKYITQYKKY